MGAESPAREGNVSAVDLPSAQQHPLPLVTYRCPSESLPLDAVRICVNPEIIETPRVSAIAKDGIELIATARVTLRADIDRLVGGAGEQTILARVGEGIVTTIGSSETHKDVLRVP